MSRHRPEPPPLDRLHHHAKAVGYWLELETERYGKETTPRMVKLRVRDQQDPEHSLASPIHSQTLASVYAAARGLDQALDDHNREPA